MNRGPWRRCFVFFFRDRCRPKRKCIVILPYSTTKMLQMNLESIVWPRQKFVFSPLVASVSCTVLDSPAESLVIFEDGTKMLWEVTRKCSVCDYSLKGKTVDHIELSIFHQRSTDLNKNEHETSIAFCLDVLIYKLRVCAEWFFIACSQHSASFVFWWGSGENLKKTFS